MDTYNTDNSELLEQKHKVRRALEETEHCAEDLKSAIHRPDTTSTRAEVALLAETTAAAAREYNDTAEDKRRMEVEKLAECDPRFRRLQPTDAARQL